MKKIFTLMLFAGFLTTAAFAQDGGRRRQNGNQYKNDRNSSSGYGRDHNGYDNDHQWEDRRRDDRYRDQHFDGYHRDRWDRDDHREGWNRDGDRGFHRNYRDHDREIRAYSYGYNRPVASFQIIIGRRARH
jgi:hypothetical protein